MSEWDTTLASGQNFPPSACITGLPSPSPPRSRMMRVMTHNTVHILYAVMTHNTVHIFYVCVYNMLIYR